MDQEHNNIKEEFLWPLLANPAGNGHAFANNLQQLINNFPQSGILRALLARSSGDKDYKQAAVYFDSRCLYKLVNEPSSFIGVAFENIVIENSIRTNTQPVEVPVPEKKPIPDFRIEDFAYLNNKENGDDDEDDDDNRELENVGTDSDFEAYVESEKVEEPESIVKQTPAEEDEAYNRINNREHFRFEPKPVVSENNNVNPASPNAKNTGSVRTEEEKLLGNVAATDFFRFEKAFPGQKEEATKQDNPSQNVSRNIRENGFWGKKDNKDVSKYHDDKMPYTFLWWLNKTRKEHASIYQPYAKSETGFSYNYNKAKIKIDELQHQYFENIFHLTTVEDLEKSTTPPTVEFDMKRKDHQLIERFIKEEPQIKPQQSDKLDNENKAKKSSEDRDELVTETLAAIYTEQMLYHKAIASYKKLILKFPEKSRFFAEKIEQLEKKTNL